MPQTCEFCGKALKRKCDILPHQGSNKCMLIQAQTKIEKLKRKLVKKKKKPIKIVGELYIENAQLKKKLERKAGLHEKYYNLYREYKKFYEELCATTGRQPIAHLHLTHLETNITFEQPGLEFD